MRLDHVCCQLLIPSDLCRQIARAVGPSGPNYEYLFRLEECLHELGMFYQY